MYRMKIELTREVLICWGSSTHKLFTSYIVCHVMFGDGCWLLLKCARVWQYAVKFCETSFPYSFLGILFNFISPSKHEKKMSYIGGEMIWRDDQRDNCHRPWPNGLSSIKIWSFSKTMRLPQILMISFKDYYYQVLFSKSSGLLLDWLVRNQLHMWGPIMYTQSSQFKRLMALYWGRGILLAHFMWEQRLMREVSDACAS